MLTKKERYYYDYQAVKENGRNRRTVWSINTAPFSDAHFATFPPSLIEPCILAATQPDEFVLDPFFGSGTVGVVCQRHQRKFVGIELNSEYIKIAKSRLHAEELPILKVAGEPYGGN